MLVIRSAEEMACALRSPPDPQCGQLLQLQWDRLSEWADYPLEELAIFLIVQAGDTLDQAEAAFGRSLVSDSHFAFLPELIDRHGAWRRIDSPVAGCSRSRVRKASARRVGSSGWCPNP